METDRYDPYWDNMQHEIKTKGFLLSEEGKLNLSQIGYAKTLIVDYNPEKIRVYPFKFLNRLRLKEWDYYGVTTKDFFFSATVSNIGYLGLVFVYFIDFDSRKMIEKTVVTPFGMGCVLPKTSETGDIVFRKRGISIAFLRENERRIIKIDWKQFNKGADLFAELVLYQPVDMDSIALVTPIGKEKFFPFYNRFYYNQKTNCMPAEGQIALGDKRYVLTKNDALATLDWGRGVWAYKTFWNWASASGFLKDGRTVGLNLGTGFGRQVSATENCFFIDGKMTKLGYVYIDYDKSDYMMPWRFTSQDGRLKLSFDPFFERVAKINLGLLKSEAHQMFGTYYGRLFATNGERIEISNLIGWAEEHRARW